MITKRIAFGLIIALLVSLLIVSGQFKARAGGASAPSLEGSWDVTVGPSGPTQFKTLITYGRGGSLVATAPVVPPPFHASTVHGTWERTGNKFTSTFLSLLYDPTGQFVGTLKVRETITPNDAGDQYDGISSIEVFDPFGNLIPTFSSCGGTSHGTRINAEPPACL